MLTRFRIKGFLNPVYRTKAGLWISSVFVSRHRNVLAVLGRPDGKLLIPGSNIITNDGDLHYAQRAVSEALTNAFDVLELGSAGTPAKDADRSDFTPIASTEKAHDGTYPLRNDADADNTGAGVDIVTFLASYAKGDFNAASITHGWITNATPGASEPILTGYAFAAGFEKTSDDTLKVFTNHTMNGV